MAGLLVIGTQYYNFNMLNGYQQGIVKIGFLASNV